MVDEELELALASVNTLPVHPTELQDPADEFVCVGGDDDKKSPAAKKLRGFFPSTIRECHRTPPKSNPIPVKDLKITSSLVNRTAVQESQLGKKLAFLVVLTPLIAILVMAIMKGPSGELQTLRLIEHPWQSHLDTMIFSCRGIITVPCKVASSAAVNLEKSVEKCNVPIEHAYLLASANHIPAFDVTNSKRSWRCYCGWKVTYWKSDKPDVYRSCHCQPISGETLNETPVMENNTALAAIHPLPRRRDSIKDRLVSSLEVVMQQVAWLWIKSSRFIKHTFNNTVGARKLLLGSSQRTVATAKASASQLKSFVRRVFCSLVGRMKSYKRGNE